MSVDALEIVPRVDPGKGGRVYIVAVSPHIHMYFVL
jgi:hypothetical protein